MSELTKDERMAASGLFGELIPELNPPRLDRAEVGNTTPFDPADFSGPAHREMMRQFAHCGVPVYTLDAMWRATGSPEGLDPKTWLKAAEGLVSGVLSYNANLDRLLDQEDDGFSDVSVYIAEDTDTEDDCWRIGDRCATQLLAAIYARFLDYAESPRPAPTGEAKRHKTMRLVR